MIFMVLEEQRTNDALCLVVNNQRCEYKWSAKVYQVIAIRVKNNSHFMQVNAFPAEQLQINTVCCSKTIIINSTISKYSKLDNFNRQTLIASVILLREIQCFKQEYLKACDCMFYIQIMHKGRQKKLDNLAERRHSTQIPPKTSLLHQHSTKIEQKLNQLKEQITEKRKISLNDKKDAKTVTSELKLFMLKIGMNDYLGCFQQNGIDCLEVLRQIKQSQLQQIGVAKGHALKIVVNLRKDDERSKKKNNLQEQKSRVESTLDQSSIKSQVEKIEKKIVKGVPQIFQMQTESIPLQLNKKQFCLYCLSRSKQSFCGASCQNLYNSMFEKYENNLQQAESNFLPKQEENALRASQEQLSDNQEFLQNFDFLFDPQRQQLDIAEYDKIKSLLEK